MKNLKVKTKLLIFLTLVFVLTISYITYNSIVIESKDKVNNAQQAQLTELKLLNSKFTDLITNISNTLRTIGSINVQQKTLDEYNNEISNILQNQREIKSLIINEIPLFKGVSSEKKFSNSKDPNVDNLTQNHLVKNFQRIQNKEPVIISNINYENKAFLIYSIIDYNYEKTYNSKVLVYSGIIDLTFLDQYFNFLVYVIDDQGQILYTGEKNYNENLFFLFKIFNKNLKNAEVRSAFSNNQEYIYAFDTPYKNIYTVVAQPKVKVLAYLYQFVQRTIIIGLIAVIFSFFIMTKIIQKVIAKPLEEIKKATTSIADGNFDVKIKLDTLDEVGELASSFNKMSEEISSLLDEKIEKTKMENELNISATVQNNILPKSLIQDPDFTIHSFYKSASFCGGDLWNFFKTKDHLYIFIADATGHELASAFITFSAKTVFSIIETIITDSNKHIEPNEILALANKAIYDSSNGNINMTMFCAKINLKTMSGTYANAAHNPPWVILNSQMKKSLCSTGPRLGSAPSLKKDDFELKEIKIDRDCKLLLYTDGIIEGSIKQEQYGKKRMLESIKKPVIYNNPLFHILNDFLSWMNYPNNLEDDLTIVWVDFSQNSQKEKNQQNEKAA